MKITIEPYPHNADCVFMLGLDDLHPEGIEDKERLDFGKDFRGFFWKQMDMLVKRVPDIRITLFTVASWTDRSNFPSGIFWPLRVLYSRRRSYSEGFSLNEKKYASWRKQLLTKLKSGNIVLSYHGLTHHNTNKRFAASQEFLGLSKNEIAAKLESMKKIFTSAQLPVENGFRSPGWGMSDELENILEKKKFEYTANSSDFVSPILKNKTNGAGQKGKYIYLPTISKGGMYNYTANCFSFQIDRAVAIAKEKGIIFVHGHVAETIFGIKYVDKNFVKRIESMVKEIQLQTHKKIWFATPSEVTRFLKIRQQLSVRKISDGKVRILNNGNEAITNLTVSIANKPFVIKRISKHSHIDIDPTDTVGEKKVSVILTVYNGEKYIHDSLNSLARQTYTNIEIIVVNDGSTDRTADIVSFFIKETGDKRIRLINQKNGGRSNARNNGFKKTSGEIVTFCEDDAIYEKHYIENAVRHFNVKNKKLAGVIGPHYVWNRKESLLTRAKDLERRRNFHNYKPQTGWFYDRSLFESVGMYDESLELVEDVVPGTILRKKGYTFVYEPNARWLHKEPSSIGLYLRRKFKGGVGMALLQKKKIRDAIVPPLYFILLVAAMIVEMILLLSAPVLFIIVAVIGCLLLVLIRIKSIKLAKTLSNESYPFIIFGIIYEYLWWSSTFLGYLYGLTMREDEIIRYLRGR